MKHISVSLLKANLSATLRSIRSGDRFIVMDHHSPVARLEPYTDTPSLILTPPRTALDLTPPDIACGTDPLALLLEDRQR